MSETKIGRIIGTSMPRALTLTLGLSLVACHHEATPCELLANACDLPDGLVTELFGRDRIAPCQDLAASRDEAQCASRLASCRVACGYSVHPTDSEILGCFAHGAGAERRVLCLGSESDPQAYALWQGPAGAEGESVAQGRFEVMEWSDILWLGGGPLPICANVRFAPSYGLITSALVEGSRADACYPPRDRLSMAWGIASQP